MSKTLFLYIDALDINIIKSSTMPFLFNYLKKNNFSKLKNIYGYSFAIQTTLLSGKLPEDNGQWMPFYYSPESIPLLFKLINKFENIFPIDIYFPSLYSNALFLLQKVFKRRGVSCNYIPLKLIKYFSVFPYYYMCELPYFQDFQNKLSVNFNISLKYIGPPVQKKDYYKYLLDYEKKGKNLNEFIILYDDKLDGLGHKYGPSSPEYSNYSIILDKYLCRVYNYMQNKYNDFSFIIFSDHSQYNCEKKIDLINILKNYKITYDKDYIIFIDATIALIWPKNNIIKNNIIEILNQNDFGKIIYIPFNDVKYGEIIFQLNPGITFIPNFYSPNVSMKGLHGYDPNEVGQNAFIISNKKIPNNINHIKDVKKYIMNIL